MTGGYAAYYESVTAAAGRILALVYRIIDRIERRHLAATFLIWLEGFQQIRIWFVANDFRKNDRRLDFKGSGRASV